MSVLHDSTRINTLSKVDPVCVLADTLKNQWLPQLGYLTQLTRIESKHFIVLEQVCTV